MMLEFTVGINIAGKHESVTVAAEDALIAALKVKCERPDAMINYVRRAPPSRLREQRLMRKSLLPLQPARPPTRIV
jgi:hypothetical protein